MKPEPTKTYVGWVTSCAFAAISALFGVLWQVQAKSYNAARADLREEKVESKARRKSDSIAIAQKDLQILNCDDNALDDLEKKMKQAERMRISASADYKKTKEDYEISKQNEKNLSKATEKVKNALQHKN